MRLEIGPFVTPASANIGSDADAVADIDASVSVKTKLFDFENRSLSLRPDLLSQVLEYKTTNNE